MKPLNNNEIFGSWATLLLTTDIKGNIDYSKLNDEIDILISSKPNGIYSNGTSGEFYSQSEEEFNQVNEMLSAKCEKAKIPFQIGVNHMSPQLSLERLKRIKTLKPGAVQVILPDWFPPTLEESVIFLKKMEEASENIPLVLYNPLHAKKKLLPTDWRWIKERIPNLVGLKVFDNNRDPKWYKMMKENSNGLSIFIPGHNLATGLSLGAQGTYSNMACLNPFAAQKWYNLAQTDMDSDLEQEERINKFMKTVIEPFITKHHYPNHSCDRFMAIVGGWADVGARLRWPYKSIPEDLVGVVKKKVKQIIPEFTIVNK